MYTVETRKLVCVSRRWWNQSTYNFLYADAPLEVSVRPSISSFLFRWVSFRSFALNEARRRWVDAKQDSMKKVLMCNKNNLTGDSLCRKLRILCFRFDNALFAQQ